MSYQQILFFIVQIILGITCAFMTINWFISFITTLVSFHNKTISVIKTTELLKALKVNSFYIIILYTVFILLY